jgi:hypothetical protein
MNDFLNFNKIISIPIETALSGIVFFNIKVIFPHVTLSNKIC